MLSAVCAQICYAEGPIVRYAECRNAEYRYVILYNVQCKIKGAIATAILNLNNKNMKKKFC